jgi:hypothetical protein
VKTLRRLVFVVVAVTLVLALPLGGFGWVGVGWILWFLLPALVYFAVTPDEWPWAALSAALVILLYAVAFVAAVADPGDSSTSGLVFFFLPLYALIVLAPLATVPRLLLHVRNSVRTYRAGARDPL